MRPVRNPMLVAVVALLVVVPAGQSSVEPWALEAQQRLEAMEQAGRRGIADHVRFVAPDVVMSTVLGVSAEGRADLGRWLATAAGPTLDELTYGDIYLDAAGAVVEEHFEETPAPMAPGDDLAVLDMGSHGLISRSLHPFAVEELASRLPSMGTGLSEYGERELETAAALAATYLEAWSSADRSDVQALYAPSARLIDSLLGVVVQGRVAIASHAATRAAEAPATLRQHALPEGGGPAIYIIWPDGFRSALEHEFRLFVVYTADDGTACPGRLVASLGVSAGIIEDERRYHEIDAVRRCQDTEQLPPGWWSALDPPPALPQDEVTGVVEVGDQRIEIHDGTADLERLVRWAMRRFESADLAAPAVRSVAFGREANFLQCTGQRSGLTLDVGESSEVFVCLGEADACTTGACSSFTTDARLIVLHELAHAWMLRHLGHTAQQAFLDHMGVERWTGPDLRWDRRGVEQAAQVIAWGLMDRFVATPLLRDHSCGELAEAFRLLTGEAPPQARCATARP